VVLICIGISRLVNEAFEFARKGGRVNVFVGLADEGWTEVAANLIHYNQLEVTGVTGVRRSDYEVALRP
jgi:L-iditol 2-dehydrogenase